MPVQRLLAFLLALTLLAGAAAASAQDATPAADRPAATSGDGANAAGDPLVGTAVPYPDENGDEIGTVTIVEVTDPYDDLEETALPDEGFRYVAVEVAVAATGEQLEASPSDFGLQTTDGFFFGNTFVSRQVTSSSIPDLDTITVDVDDEVAGLLFFELPTAAELARILWQPESGRLLVLADLRDQNDGRA